MKYIIFKKGGLVSCFLIILTWMILGVDELHGNRMSIWPVKLKHIKLPQTIQTIYTGEIKSSVENTPIELRGQ